MYWLHLLSANSDCIVQASPIFVNVVNEDLPELLIPFKTLYCFIAKIHPKIGTVGKATFDTACRKSLFATLCKFSELHKSSENLGFQWRRETGEAPPVADEASLFRGRLPNSGYKVSAVWLEPTVYPFLSDLRAKSRLRRLRSGTRLRAAVQRTPFTRKGYAASVKRRSR